MEERKGKDKLISWRSYFQRKPLLFVIKLVGFYLLLSSLFSFLIGLTSPGGSFYSPWMSENFDVIATYRTFLLSLASFFVQLFGYQTTFNTYDLFIENGEGIRLVYSCLGLSVKAAFTALILAYPSEVREKIIYLIIGITAIIVFNTIRLGGLVILYTRQNTSLFDIIDHHDLFNIIIYAIVLLIFASFTKKVKSRPKTN